MGHTAAERRLAFPCDSLLTHADAAYYRSVTMHAAPPQVTFRWLCQLRVAPYSYDWIVIAGGTRVRRGVAKSSGSLPGLQSSPQTAAGRHSRDTPAHPRQCSPRIVFAPEGGPGTCRGRPRRGRDASIGLGSGAAACTVLAAALAASPVAGAALSCPAPSCARRTASFRPRACGAKTPCYAQRPIMRSPPSWNPSPSGLLWR